MLHLVGLSTHCNMMHGTYNVKSKRIQGIFSILPAVKVYRYISLKKKAWYTHTSIGIEILSYFCSHVACYYHRHAQLGHVTLMADKMSL